MAGSEHSIRLEAALCEINPTLALGRLAEALKTEGMSQPAMRELFTEYLKAMEEQGNAEAYDAIADTLDRITGWCSHGHLFDTPKD